MAELMIPDLVGSYQRAYANSAEQRRAQMLEQRRNQLAGLASQAYAAPEEQRSALVQQAVGIDPDAGFGLDKQLRAGDADRETQLLNSARMIDAAPEPMKNAIFQQVRPKIGAYLPGLPEVYDQQVGQGIKAFIASRTKPGDDGLPSDIRSLEYLQAHPELLKLDRERRQAAGMVPKLIETASGYTWGAPGGTLVPAYEGQAPASGGTPSPLQDFHSLGNLPGVQTSSLYRDPERNRRVGGVSNSQHMGGTAGDFVMAPGQKAAFMAQARALGYEAIDEGDHVHVELPTGGANTSTRAMPGGRDEIAKREKELAGLESRGATISTEDREQYLRTGKFVDAETPGDLAKSEMSMRKELADLNKDDQTIVSAFSKVNAAAQNPSAQNDLALIFAYMKMLDPGSVVREGEFANAQNAAGIPDRIANAYNRSLRGERLNPDQRSGFVSSARDLYNGAIERVTDRTRQQAETAEAYGYDPVRATGSQQGSPQYRQQFDRAGQLLQEARQAIQSGKDPAAVRQRLVEMGFSNIAGRL